MLVISSHLISSHLPPPINIESSNHISELVGCWAGWEERDGPTRASLGSHLFNKVISPPQPVYYRSFHLLVPVYYRSFHLFEVISPHFPTCITRIGHSSISGSLIQASIQVPPPASLASQPEQKPLDSNSPFPVEVCLMRPIE